jgi:hypothetical protein
VLVTATEGVPDEVDLTGRPSGASSIRFIACNNGTADVALGQATLRYITIEF